MPTWLRRARLTREWAVVALMVASAILSAICFFQATRYAESSTDLTNQARFAEAQEAQQRSAIEAQIAHDRRVLLACVTAIGARDTALRAHSRSFGDADFRKLVSAEQRRISLQALLVADSGGCGDYQVSRALEVSAFGGQQRLAGDPADLERRRDAFDRAEGIALMAAVAFALVLLLLTLSDSTTRRFWTNLWLGAALVSALSGTVLVSQAVLMAGEAPLVAIAVVLALVVILGLAAIALMPVTVSSVRSRMRRRARRWSTARPLRATLLDRQARWWAEVLGAMTLVVFALGALGYSLSSTQERRAVATADRLTVEAGDALELGEQSALATLNYTSELSALDAEVAADAQSPQEGQTGTGGVATAREDARELLLTTLWDAERKAWKDLYDSRLGGTTPGGASSGDEAAPSTRPCAPENLVLAWGDEPAEPDEPLPLALLTEFRIDRDVLTALISKSSRGATVCWAQAALTWQEAEGWGARATLFTVALVVLGLAGFLFALAADPGRTTVPRRWLLTSGAIGFLTGGLVSVLAWASVPIPPPDEVRRTGTTAYAEAEHAIVMGDCESARTHANVAATDLRDFAPAQVMKAYAYSCSPQGGWLAAPHMDDEALKVFRDSLERTVEDMDSQDATAIGNLGWAYLLTGLGGEAGVDLNSIDRGLALSRTALELEPDNPYFAFNIALGLLARGDAEESLVEYERALTDLRGTDGDDPRYGETFLQDLVRVSALADLELLADGPQLDTVRELIVTGATDPTERAEVADGGPSINLYPQQIGLLSGTDKSTAGDAMAVVWYHRAGPDDPWAVLISPTVWTLEPTAMLDLLWSLDRSTGLGEHRADLYVGGNLAQRVTTSEGWWTARDLSANDFQWVQAPDLGISAILPRGWEVISALPGEAVTFGCEAECATEGDSIPGHVAFRRLDGAAAEAMDQELLAWSETLLEAWDVPVPERTDEGSELTPGNWYLGLGEDEFIVEQDNQTGVWRAAGNRQYLVSSADAHLSDVTDPTCPGTTLMTLVHSAEPGVADTVWWSQVLQGELNTAQVETIDLRSSFVSAQFALAFPEDWKAAGCPGKLVVEEPQEQANLIVNAEEAAADLGTSVDQSIQDFRDRPKEFIDFELEERVPIRLSTGTAAIQIDFRWVSGDLPISQRQVYAQAGGTLFVMTFTTTTGNAGIYDEEWQLMIDSFRPAAVESVITAICDGCGIAERHERQTFVDEIASQLSIIDGRSCEDTSESRPEGALAAISCAFAGGFTAEFGLWPDLDALDTFSTVMESAPDALIQDWFLYGDSEVPTGLTVEWVEEGDAWFYWTYDEQLLTGFALLPGGDQERLNQWWQTGGALLNE